VLAVSAFAHGDTSAKVTIELRGKGGNSVFPQMIPRRATPRETRKRDIIDNFIDNPA
jgi:hypothetical protein